MGHRVERKILRRENEETDEEHRVSSFNQVLREKPSLGRGEGGGSLRVRKRGPARRDSKCKGPRRVA